MIGQKSVRKKIELPKKSLSISAGIARSFGTRGICAMVKSALLPSSVNIPAPVGQFLFSAPSNCATEDNVASCSTESGDGACCPCAPRGTGRTHVARPRIPNTESGTRIGSVSSLQPTPMLMNTVAWPWRYDDALKIALLRALKRLTGRQR